MKVLTTVMRHPDQGHYDDPILPRRCILPIRFEPLIQNGQVAKGLFRYRPRYGLPP